MVSWTDLQLEKQKRRERRKSEHSDRFNRQWKARQAWKFINYHWLYLSSEYHELITEYPYWQRNYRHFSARCESVPLNRKTRHKVKQALRVGDFDTSKYDLKLPYVD